jgi:p24 family protein delta-1
MAPIQSLLYSLCSLLLFLSCVEALKFDLEAFSQGDKKGERCIRNFVAKDTLVVVTATLDGYKGDGMVVNMHVGLNVYIFLRQC